MQKILHMPSLPRLVNAKVVAEAINATPKHVYDLAKRGKVPHYRFEGSVRFDPQEIKDWLADHKAA